MSPVTAPSAWKPFSAISTLNVSPPSRPLSQALTVKAVVLVTPRSKNVPTASNSAPLLAVVQKLELERNAVKEVPVSVFPRGSEAKNLPCTPVASDVTSNVKVITPPSGSWMVPVPLNSPVCGGGGWFHACSLGRSGLRASLHAVATTSSATAAAETLREMVRFMGAPLQERRVREPPGQNADRVSRAQQRAATAPDGAQPHRPLLRARGVARERHHPSRAWPVRSTVAIVSVSSARLSGR